MFFTHMTGHYIPVYFANSLYRGLDTEVNTLICVQTALMVIATLFTVFWVDVFNRRHLLIWGGVGMCFCYLILGIIGSFSIDFPNNCFDNDRLISRISCGFTSENSPLSCEFLLEDKSPLHQDFTDRCPISGDNKAYFNEHTCGCGSNVETWFKTITIMLIMCYTVFFSFSWGPLPFVISTEMLPNRIRGKISGLALFFSALGFAFVRFITELMLNDIAYGTFIFYAACLVICIFFAWTLPETSQVPLEHTLQRSWFANQMVHRQKRYHSISPQVIMQNAHHHGTYLF